MESSKVKPAVKGSRAVLGDIGVVLKSLDLFAAPLPQFNIRGEQEVKTYFGGLISLMIMIVTAIFAMIKLQHLLSHKNPSISVFNEEIEASEENSYQISDEFMLAFGLDSAFGLKNDERIVKWVVRHEKVSKGWLDRETKYYPVRNCTQDDFKRFYPPRRSSENTILNFQ